MSAIERLRLRDRCKACGDVDGIADDRPRAVREPVVEAAVEREAGDDATRIAGGIATTLNRATMRMWSRAAARPRRCASTSEPTSQADDEDEEGDQDPVDDHRREHDRLGRRDRRQAHQDEEGPRGDRQGEDHPDIAGRPHDPRQLESRAVDGRHVPHGRRNGGFDCHAPLVPAGRGRIKHPSQKPWGRIATIL